MQTNDVAGKSPENVSTVLLHVEHTLYVRAHTHTHARTRCTEVRSYTVIGKQFQVHCGSQLGE